MSKQDDRRAELHRFGDLIDSIVTISDPSGLITGPSLSAKLDVLERAIDEWRFQTDNPRNGLSIDEFLQCDLLFDNNQFAISLPDTFSNLGAGTSAIHFQPRLLVFLLLHHRNGLTILQIIERFIGKIRSQLKLLDFKKTQTGVTPCFTNTRFAANKLRDYGLLKFTRKEAYKTWVLSLPGFLVASRLLERRIDWSLPPVAK